MKNLYIGIDPGESGGMAVIDNTGAVISSVAFKHSTPKDISDLLQSFVTEARMAYLERVSAMPGQGVSSTFKFGTNFGLWQGLLTAHGIPFELVTPRKWQAGLAIKPRQKKSGETTTDFKNRLKQNAQNLFGGQAKITHANADALLIAEYCRRMYNKFDV